MLSLILPTYNEASNLPELIDEIEEAMYGVPFEVIVVDDDSLDRTWETAESIGNFVRVIRRVGRRGLSSAVVEGFQAAEGDVLAVMDSDGQHDPCVLPYLYGEVKRGAAVAIGSRYVPGGSVEGFAKPRHFMSRVATILAWLVTPMRVQDPMSGFFAIDRNVFQSCASALRPRGFKILLEILAHLPRYSHIVEVPLEFRKRRSGESKLDASVQRAYLFQVSRLFFQKRQGFLFGLSVLVIAVVLLFKIWTIRLLYLDHSTQSRVSTAVIVASDEHEWLLSGISITSLTNEYVTLQYRSYQRGKDSHECAIVHLLTLEIIPCSSS